MKIDDEIRQYLAAKYNCDPNTDIDVDGQSVHVTGIMPNSNTHGQFYAGELGDIQWELEREADYQRRNAR